MLRTLRSHAVPLIVIALLVIPAAAAEEPPPETAPPERTEAATDGKLTPPLIILKTQKAPIYPPAALAGRFTGAVTLRVTVLKDGKVGDIEIVRCSHPNLGFEQASIAAVKLWQFEPATKNGEPVEYERKFKLNFRHSGDGSGRNPYVSASVVDERSSTPLTFGSDRPR